MGAMASEIASLTIVYSTVYSGADIKKNIKAPRHWPLCGNSPMAGEVPARMASNAKKFIFDDVVMVRCVTIFYH